MKLVEDVFKEQKGMAVQTLVFSKGKFKSIEEAKKWARQHEFSSGKVDETDDSYRVRQHEASAFMDGTFRTIELTDGVKAVMGKYKEAMSMDCAPWNVRDMPPEAGDLWCQVFNKSWTKNDKLDDAPRMIQAQIDADEAVRAKGWVRGPGGWMMEANAELSEVLPDSGFALIEAGGTKDSEGKTSPRSLRKFPHHKPDGSVDVALLKGAMSQLMEAKLKEDSLRTVLAHLTKHVEDERVEMVTEGKGTLGDETIQVKLKEAKFDGKKGELVAVLIEAGTNMQKRRHYPVKTVERAASLFSGLKQYINHPTEREEAERPERDLRDWGSTIVEAWPDGGKAMARIAVHDKWLKELLEDPVARENIGLSINCRGKSYIGQIDGQQVQIIEELVVTKGQSSVDWVTEPGARGRVVQVFESRKGDLEMLDTITLKDLKQHRPELVEALEAETRETIKKEGTGVDEAKVKEVAEAAGKAAAERRFGELQEGARTSLIAQQSKEEKLQAVIEQVTSQADFLLPKVSKDRVFNQLKERTFADDAAIKTAVESAVKAEKAYLKEVGSTKITTGGNGNGGQQTPLREGFEGDLTKRFGLEQKEEAKK